MTDTVLIDAARGGVLQADSGLVEIRFPPGAVTETAAAAYRAVPPPQQAVADQRVALSFTFDLTAETIASGARAAQPVTRFAKPLDFVIDLGQLGYEPGYYDGRTVWFGYFDERAQTWQPIDFSLSDAGGTLILSAAVDHFSQFGVGSDPKPGWKMTFNEPHVSLFSGAGTYSHPLNLPAGRNGVGPSLSFSYNSRGIDHIRSWTQSDWVGHGWSLDSMEIVRRMGTNTTQSSMDCTSDFSLNFNGATYRLVPGSGVTVLGQYFTQEDSGLKVERLSNAAAPNVSDHYWQVTDGTGTVYRFGWNADSEQTLPSNCAGAESFGGQSVFRWRLDKVKDLYSNVMKFIYVEEARQNSGCGMETGDRASYLHRIYYNNTQRVDEPAYWFTEIKFMRQPRPSANVTDDGWGACGKLLFQSEYLDNVQIISSGYVIYRYQLGYQSYTDPQRLSNFAGIPGTASRELIAITEYGYNAAGGSAALPATTFSYGSYQNSDTDDCTPGLNCGAGPGNCPGGWCGEPTNPGGSTYYCRYSGSYQEWYDNPGIPPPNHVIGNPLNCLNFNYWRLKEIRNGYGAVSTFDYQDDGRSTFWLGGYAYRVSQRTIRASETGTVGTWVYNYATPCYNNTNAGDPLPAGGIQCKLPSPAQSDGQLMGYAAVTVTAKNYDNSIISITHHKFRTNEDTRLLGREYRTEWYDAAGQLLQDQDSAYSVMVTNNHWHARLDSTTQRSYSNSSTVGQTQLTTFGYDVYTNLVDTVESIGGQLYRRTQQGFYPSQSLWIVSKPGYKNISFYVPSSGSCPTGSFSAIGAGPAGWCLTESTWFSYDSNPSFSTAISGIGQLTAVRRWTGSAFVDTLFGYSAWGNQTTQTTFKTFGTNTTYARDISGASPATTTTVFDGRYNLHPVQTINAAGHADHTVYDLRLGLPLTVTAANGAVTSYGYDGFGRLTDVYRPGDAAGDPSLRYTYGFPGGTPNPFMIEEWHKPVSFPTNSTRHFYDGLGREIQTHAARSAAISGLTGNHDILVSRVFDAWGRVISETMPYASPAYYTGLRPSPYLAAVPGGTSSTRTVFDSLSRTVRVIGSDGTVTSSVYGAGSQASQDANGHIGLSFTDGFGRLSAVDETLVKWRDTFSDGVLATADWTVVGNAVETGGVGRIVGNGTWNNYMQRKGNLREREGVVFSFRLTTAAAAGTGSMYMRAGTWNTSSYRTWGLGVANGYLSRDTEQGTGGVQRVLLMPVKANTWYRVVIKLGDTSQPHIVRVWERDNPAVSAEQSNPRDASWTNINWQYMAQVHTGTFEVDDLDEVSIYRTRYAYNAVDQLTSLTTVSTTNSISYNVLGQKTSMIDPDMGAWQYTYDAIGNLTRQTDARNSNLCFYYDTLGRMTGKHYNGSSTTCPNPITPTIKYEYDGLSTARIEGEDYSLQSGSTGPDSKSAASGGEVLGNNWGSVAGHYARYNALTFGWANRNSVLHLVYANNTGSANRLQVYVDDVYKGEIRIETTGGWGTSAQHFAVAVLDLGPLIPGTHSVQFNSPANGNGTNLDYFTITDGQSGQRTALHDGSGNTHWSYNKLQQLTRETKFVSGSGSAGGTFVTQWGYDPLGRPAWTKYPNGNAGLVSEQVNFGYNSQGWLNTVVGADTYVNATSYDAAGRVELQQLGSAAGNYVIGLDYVYFPWTTANGQGRVQQLKAGAPSNLTSLFNFSYTYDAVGNIKTIVDTKAGGTQTQTFSYDSLDRLVTAQAAGGSGGTYTQQTYAYNAIGNLTANTQWGNYAYGAGASGCRSGTPALKPHAVSAAGAHSFSYDCNGNMTTRTITGTTYTQTFNAENRLTTVSGGAAATFVYDGDGGRVTGTIGGVTTIYIGNHYEWTGSTTTAKKYYYAGGQRVAMRVGSTLYFLLGDHLGSTSKVATATGAFYSEVRYGPWGAERHASGTTPTSFRYTGQRLESGLSGLYFYNARWYDSVTGRFISADSIVPGAGNPQSLNRYSYVLNNPLKYTDPSGHFPWPIVVAAVVVTLKIIDYGWTGYDVWQASKVLQDPSASQEAKNAASLNVTMALAFEAAEPDDALPIGLPLDDLIRRGLVKQLPLPGMEDLAPRSWAVRVTKLPIQSHHILSNKHTRKWTAAFDSIVSQYGLDLDGAWNQIDIPHRPTGHPDRYHQWLYEQLQDIDGIARGDQQRFLQLYNERIRQKVLDHPEMLFDDWWDMMSP